MASNFRENTDGWNSKRHAARAFSSALSQWETLTGLDASNLREVPSSNVAGLPSGTAGDMAYVTDGDAGNPCLAVHDGSGWKRIALGATVSAT